MIFMKYMLIFIVVIIFVNYYYLNTSNTYITPSDNSLGFVKPEHRLYKILSKISSGSKIKLHGNCNKYFFNKNTINTDVKANILNILNKMIDTIKHISNQDYYIKNIENVYCLVAEIKDLIIDFFHMM